MDTRILTAPRVSVGLCVSLCVALSASACVERDYTNGSDLFACGPAGECAAGFTCCTGVCVPMGVISDAGSCVAAGFGDAGPTDADAGAEVVDLCAGKTCDDGNPCTKDSCDPATGACVNKPLDGVACDDGSVCTKSDLCAVGLCKGLTITCDDANACTDDTCDAKKGCVHLPNAATCDDGDACTTKDTCAVGLCSGVTVTCNDGNGCTDDTCDHAKGCVSLPNTVSCDDGEPCTVGDACSGGACKGAPDTCDDANPCTDDACKTGSGCTHVNNTSPCENTMMCGSCVKGVCSPLEPKPWLAQVPSPHTPAAVGTPPGGGYVLGGRTGTPMDAWLGRFDATGKLVWSKTYGGPEDDALSDLAVLPDGGYALAGTTASKGAGKRDVWLWRADAGAALKWDATFGGAEDEAERVGLAVLPDGYAVAGTSLPVGASETDGLVGRVAADGKLLYSKTYGGDGADALVAAAPADSDGLYAVGHTTSSGAGGRDLWLIHLDAAGALTWQRTLGGAGDEAAQAVVALPDGLLILDARRADPTAPERPWIVRTDVLGNLLWSKALGEGKTNDVLRRLVPVSGGGYALTGSTEPTPGSPGLGWVLRLDAFANTVWSRTYGDGLGDDARGASAIDDGGLYVAGPGALAGGQSGYRVARMGPWGDTSCGGAGKCLVVHLLDCDDGNACTVDSCNAKLPSSQACQHAAAPDGTPCGNTSTCKAGTCGPPACTCATDADCLPFDPDLCDGGLVCDGCYCKADNKPVVCDTSKDDACIATACNPKTGACDKTASADGTPCSDGDACTGGDACTTGACTPGPTPLCELTCNDGKDDNANGKTDCDDAQCIGKPACSNGAECLGNLPRELVFCGDAFEGDLDADTNTSDVQNGYGLCSALSWGGTEQIFQLTIKNKNALPTINFAAPPEARLSFVPVGTNASGNGCTATACAQMIAGLGAQSAQLTLPPWPGTSTYFLIVDTQKASGSVPYKITIFCSGGP